MNQRKGDFPLKRYTSLILLISFILILTSLFVTGCFLSSVEPQPSPTENPTPSPSISPNAVNFTLPDLNGNSVSLSDYRGKPVLAVFFSYSCRFCRDQASILEEIYQKYHGSKELEILGIGVSISNGEIAQFKNSYGWTFQALNDNNREAYLQFFSFGVPALIFIKRSGELAIQKLGYLNMTELEQWLQAYIL